MKVAIVHDWITNLGGAERTVRALLDTFPNADLYTSVYDPSSTDLFHNVEVHTTWLQKIPGRLKFKHQLWVPLRPLAFRSLKLKDYDIIISSSSAEAKQVRGGKQTVHICYCHTPIRYFWVNPEKYKNEPGLGPLNFMAPLIMPLFLRSLKKSDYRAAQKVDVFLANSKAVQKRITDFYNRDSTVVYPPVQLERFSTLYADNKSSRISLESVSERSRESQQAVSKYGDKRIAGSKPKMTKKSTESLAPPKNRSIAEIREGFVTAGRQVAYKRHDLAIEACNKLQLPLLVLGNGPEHERLKKLAGPTITFNNNPSDQDIETAFASAKAFIHPGEEDFGITPIEALASGAPVIAYKAGGALDYVVNGENGLFFDTQSVDSLVEVLKKFNQYEFKAKDIAKTAEKFSGLAFAKSIEKTVEKALK